MTGEVVGFLVLATAAVVVGIALGMLAAPAIGRLADRVGRADDEPLDEHKEAHHD